MTIEDMHTLLDSDKATTAALQRHLQEAAARQQAHPEQSQQIAYELAGLLSTKHVQALPEGSVHTEILMYAGILELPEGLHGEANWEELQRKIAAINE